MWYSQPSLFNNLCPPFKQQNSLHDISIILSNYCWWKLILNSQAENFPKKMKPAVRISLLMLTLLSEDAQGRSMTLSYESAMEVILAQFFIINVVAFVIKQLLGVWALDREELHHSEDRPVFCVVPCQTIRMGCVDTCGKHGIWKLLKDLIILKNQNIIYECWSMFSS